MSITEIENRPANEGHAALDTFAHDLVDNLSCDTSEVSTQSGREFRFPRPAMVDGKSRIVWPYIISITLFHLLIGTPPFTGASSTDLLNKHLSTPPPQLDIYHKNVTPEFSKLVQASMAKDRDGRPSSMDAFLRELQAVQVFRRRPPPPGKTDGGGNPT